MNRAQMREVDALEAAVIRRRKILTGKTGIISLNPARAAKEMSDAVQASISRSMEGVKDTFRDFAFGLLDKEAPDLPEEEKAKLVESWIPASPEAWKPGSGYGEEEFSPGDVYTGLAHKGKINGIPCDAMNTMIHQFMAYSTGAMSFSDEAALRRDVGDWTAIYWHKFPEKIQRLIKACLSGKCTAEEFEAALAGMLG